MYLFFQDFFDENEIDLKRIICFAGGNYEKIVIASLVNI